MCNIDDAEYSAAETRPFFLLFLVLVNFAQSDSRKVIMSKMMKNYNEPTHEEIAALAQRFYEAEGRPNGKAMEHWLRAEAQLVSERREKTMPLKSGAPKTISNAPKIGAIGPSPSVLPSPGRQDLHKN